MTVEVGPMVLVGIGEMYVTPGRSVVLVARCLGSSAAVAFHEPVAQVSGLLHWMLPDSRVDPQRADRNPCFFADTGVARLLAEIESHGGSRERIVACLAGGASLPEGGVYDVGNRNRSRGLELLKRSGIKLDRDESGGTTVRELSLETGPGDFVVRSMHI